MITVSTFMSYMHCVFSIPYNWAKFSLHIDISELWAAYQSWRKVIRTKQKMWGIFLIKLKSLGPIDHKFHGHGENDGFVLYEYIIKQVIGFCKYTNISVMKKSQIK